MAVLSIRTRAPAGLLHHFYRLDRFESSSAHSESRAEHGFLVLEVPSLGPRGQNFVTRRL